MNKNVCSQDNFKKVNHSKEYTEKIQSTKRDETDPEMLRKAQAKTSKWALND